MIVGISMVRNEVDIIATCIKHHFENEGFDKILIVDDNSTDGTFELLQKLANDRLVVEQRRGQFLQAEVVSDLARRAFAGGAQWIVPFDADEFWHAPGGIAQLLRQGTSKLPIQVEVVNFVQHWSVKGLKKGRLSAVKYRAKTVGEESDGPEFVNKGLCSYVESKYPPKFIHRAYAGITITGGNHTTSHEKPAVSEEVKCFHIPLRARSIFNAKIDHAVRLNEANFPPAHGWHLRRFERISRQANLDDEWGANSERRGHLNTKRGRIPLIYDPTLAQLVARICRKHGRPKLVLMKIFDWLGISRLSPQSGGRAPY